MNKFEIQEPMQVANFVIEQANSTNRPISNLHLQKILYFLQAAFLIEYNETPLMSGKFSRWSYGPVMVEVYDTYKENGSSIIRDVAPHIHILNGELKIDEPKRINRTSFEYGSFEFLEKATNNLIDIDPWDLVNRTHKQKIWSEFERDINFHIARDYSNEEIFNQFQSNQGDRIW